MKKFSDPGLENMPAVVQSVISEAEEAHAAYMEAREAGEDDVTIGMLKMVADQKKLMLREQRKYWRQIGVMAGTRQGVKIENNTDGDAL